MARSETRYTTLAMAHSWSLLLRLLLVLCVLLLSSLLVTLTHAQQAQSILPIAPPSIPAPYLTVVNFAEIPAPSSAGGDNSQSSTTTNTPPPLRPFIPLNMALFGGFLSDGGEIDNILIPTGEYGCLSYSSPDAGLSMNLTAEQPRESLQGRIVLVKNGGGCNFVIKADNMFHLGARAIVVYDCPLSEGCSIARKWPAASDKHPSITMFYMDYASGAGIRSAMQAGYQVKVHLPGSGKMIPEERAALTQMYREMGGFSNVSLKDQWSFYNLNRRTDSAISDKSGGLQDWNTLANQTMDPCLQRLYGITCVNGRVVQIQCANCGISISTRLSPLIGNLTELTFLSFATNRLQGTIPESIGQLTKLTYLLLSTNMLTGAIPKGLLSNTSDYYNTSTMPQPPLDLLSVIELHENQLTTISGSFNHLSLLSSLLAYGNRFVGELPSFSGLQEITTIDFHSNSFTSLHPDGFLNLPKLTLLDLHQNLINSTIPRLGGMPELLTLDLSDNSFYGPPTLDCALGANLYQLETLSLQDNSFTSPFTWSTCVGLVTVDASRNQFTAVSSTAPVNSSATIVAPSFTSKISIGTNSTLTAPVDYQTGKFLNDILPPFVTSVDFSSNLLSGGWSSGLFGRLGKLTKLYLSGNAIKNIPSDLFTSAKYASIEVFDLSTNHLTGEMPLGTPPTTLRVWKLDGNPNLVATDVSSSNVTLLPTYWKVNVDTRTPVFKSPSTNGSSTLGEYTCGTIVSINDRDNSVILTVSPTFYSYKYCTCSLGYYGHPPLCTPFPTDVVYNISSREVISDGIDAGRIRKGLDTYFYIYPTVPVEESAGNNDNMNGGGMNNNGMSASVGDDYDAWSRQLDDTSSTSPLAPSDVSTSTTTQIITIPASSIVSYRLNFSYFNFSDTTRDRLLIYIGIGTSSNPVYTFSEFSPPPLCTAMMSSDINNSDPDAPDPFVYIVGRSLTIYFTSWSSSDRHFTLQYEAMNTYPEGYLPRPYEINSILMIFAEVMIGLTILGIVALFVFLHYYRHSRLMVASSPLFVNLTLVGGVLLNLSSILFLFHPNTTICALRTWCGPIPFAMILAPLFVKSARLAKIIGSSHRLQANRPISDAELLWSMCGIMAPLVIVLIITTVLESERSRYEEILVASLGNYYLPRCSEPYVLIFTSFAYLFCLTGWGTWLSWRVRTSPIIFNESHSIMNCIIALLLYGCTVLPLQLLIKEQPNALFILRCFGYILASWLSLSILFIPKVILLRGNGPAKLPPGGIMNKTTIKERPGPDSSQLSGIRPSLKLAGSAAEKAAAEAKLHAQQMMEQMESGHHTMSSGHHSGTTSMMKSGTDNNNSSAAVPISSGRASKKQTVVKFEEDQNREVDYIDQHTESSNPTTDSTTSQEERLAEAQRNAQLNSSQIGSSFINRKAILQVNMRVSTGDTESQPTTSSSVGQSIELTQIASPSNTTQIASPSNVASSSSSHAPHHHHPATLSSSSSSSSSSSKSASPATKQRSVAATGHQQVTVHLPAAIQAHPPSQQHHHSPHFQLQHHHSAHFQPQQDHSPHFQPQLHPIAQLPPHPSEHLQLEPHHSLKIRASSFSSDPPATPHSLLSDLLEHFFEAHPQLLENAAAALGVQTLTPTSSSVSSSPSSGRAAARHLPSLNPAQLRLINSLSYKLTGEDDPLCTPGSSNDFAYPYDHANPPLDEVSVTPLIVPYNSIELEVYQNEEDRSMTRSYLQQQHRHEQH